LVRDRLPTKKRNARYAVKRLTATHKVFMQCVDALPEDALERFAAAAAAATPHQ
jgi:hypothetical protein